MFFRPETSLIPSILALSGFFIDNFPHIWWYPFWYLGNPFSYLTGPVVPLLLMISRGIVPIISLYHLYLGIISGSVFIGGIGVFFFVKSNDKAQSHGGERRNILRAIASGLLYVILPFLWIGLYNQNGLKHIAFALIPFVFIVFKNFLIKGQRSGLVKGRLQGNAYRQAGIAPTYWIYFLLLIFLISICLLVTVNALLPIIVGIIAIFIMVNRIIKYDRGAQGKFLAEWRERKFVQTLVVLLMALLLATFWYTFRFWWVILTNPSFGGVPLWNLIVKIFQLLLNFLPLVLAIFVVKWRIKEDNMFFGVIFFLSFFFLTIVRFLANPGFVIDWIGFLPELQFGLSILGGAFISGLIKKRNKSQIHRLKLKAYLIVMISLIIGVVFLVTSGYLAYNLIFYSKSDYQNDILNIFESHKITGNERIFMSGSDVFWMNSYLPVPQVRGGKDEVSIHPFWAHGAFQIREGERAGISEDWLKIFGSSYILVHQLESQDPFHDYKHPEKFKSLQLLAVQDGNKLYKIPNVFIARVADKKILNIKMPQNGADGLRLEEYTDTLKNKADFRYLASDKIWIKSLVRSNEVISLAVAFDPSWKIIKGSGRVSGDRLGNTVIVPARSGEQEFLLEYRRDYGVWILLLVLVISGSVFLWKFDDIYPILKRRIPKLNIGLGEDETHNY